MLGAEFNHASGCVRVSHRGPVDSEGSSAAALVSQPLSRLGEMRAKRGPVVLAPGDGQSGPGNAADLGAPGIVPGTPLTWGRRDGLGSARSRQPSLGDKLCPSSY